MIGASLYIAACSVRNRLRVRLRRLRQPRYLFGAIVGVAYMYFVVFARTRRRRRGVGPGRAAAAAALGPMLAAAPPVIGTVLLGVAAIAWALPFDSSVLRFSEAEVDFLFTAPLTRRQLLAHRLIRSQLGLAFAAVVPIVFYPGLSPLSRVRSAVALWLTLVTVRLYFTGVTIARRGLAAADRGARRAAFVPALAIGGAALAVAAALVRAFAHRPPGTLREAISLIREVVVSGWPRDVVAPFVALIRPLFVDDAARFFAALGAALVVSVVVCLWVVRIDGIVHDADVDGAMVAGADQPRRRSGPMSRRALWSLASAGRPETAFAWRAAVAMVRGAGGASAVRLLAVFAGLMVAAVAASRQRGLAQLLFAIAIVSAGMAIVLGPQMLRADLRQDLHNIDLLKTWPLRPADVVRGEMLWPTAVLTALAWLAIAFAAIAAAGLSLPLALRAAVASAAALLAPALVAAQLAIHNAAALAFPAWIATGGQRPRGLDAMGQRLILLGATMLLLAIALVPGVLAGGAVWLAVRPLLGLAALTPAAAACAGTVLVEVLAGTEAMAPLYEKLDYSEIERGDT